MTYQAGDVVRYDTGCHVVEAKIFRTCAHKVWIDHYTFQRARVVADNSPRLLGVA